MPITYPPDILRSLRNDLGEIPDAIRARGRAYASQGRVGALERTLGGVTARVRGTRAYVTRWLLEGANWRNSCTCAMRNDCKHAVALALEILAESPLKRSNEAPTDAAVRALEGLRSATTPWRRTGFLRDLLSAASASGARVQDPVHLHLPPFREIFEETEPDLLCYRLASALSGPMRGAIPPVLQPYLERADLRGRLASRDHEDLARRIVAWNVATLAEGGAERRLRFLLGLTVLDGMATLEVEARVTGGKLDDAPRSLNQLQVLRNEAGRRPGVLAPLELEALETYLEGIERLAYLHVPTEAPSTGGLERVLRIAGGTPLVTWSPQFDPAVAKLAGIKPGAPVRLAPRVARVVPTLTPDSSGTLVLGLAVRWEDERTRGLDSVLVLRGIPPGSRLEPDLVFADDEVAVLRGMPPADLVAEMRAVGGVALDAERHAPMLADLAQRAPSVRAALGDRVRVVSPRALITLDVPDDDRDRLLLRAFAAAAESTWVPGDDPGADDGLHELMPGARWVRIAAPTPAAIELLDAAALADVSTWMARTGAKHGARGWELRLTARSLDAFDAAWGGKPTALQVYASPRAQRLLAGGRTLRPKLSVRSTGLDWFGITAEWEGDSLELSDEDLALLQRATGRYVKLGSGWARRDVGEGIERAAEAFADLGIEAGGGERQVSAWHLALANPASLAALEELAGDGAAEAVHALRERVAAFRGLPRVDVPKAFRGELRGYQRDGVDFLAFSSSIGLGPILADDMGLGKTVQALAWLAHLRAEDPDLGPSLVVCPASVVHNWVEEASRFVPSLQVVRLTGAERKATLAREAKRADLLVTNYALLRRDVAQLRELKFGALILDEAQNLKNPAADVSRAARSLAARHRLALTGTPLENRLLDLWSILECTSPGFLGGRTAFTRRYETPDGDAGRRPRRLLAARLRPVLLRRLKSEVARELPPRTEERRDCELSTVQKKLYQEQAERGRAILAALRAGAGSLQEERFELLAILTRMRQICCHAALVGAPARTPSGKFDELFELLEPLRAEGHKVLVFSQFVECLKLVAHEMKERGIRHHVLTGSTAEKDRAGIVRAFEGDPEPSAFLVSLKAGGTGLNLTAASYVVLLDPWWNPAVEAQAIDRTHRIGQTRPVTAYRLLARGTIEDRIRDLQEKKSALAHEVLGEEGFARSLTRDDLEGLFAEA